MLLFIFPVYIFSQSTDFVIQEVKFTSQGVTPAGYQNGRFFSLKISKSAKKHPDSNSDSGVSNYS